MAGKFIVLEGMDGAGTTTQAALLARHLESRGVRVTKSAEPTKSPLGVEARRLLALPIEHDEDMLVSLALCFAADRMQHVRDTIRPSLARGDFVLLDRYHMSSLVYQGLHLPASFVKEINRYAIKPDLTLVLDIDAKLAHARLVERYSVKDFYETPETLAKIRQRYLHYAEEDKNAVIIDASGAVQQVESHIATIINQQFFS